MCFYLLTRANLLDNNGKPLGPHFVPRFRLSNLNPIGCLHIFADMCLGVDALSDKFLFVAISCFI